MKNAAGGHRAALFRDAGCLKPEAADQFVQAVRQCAQFGNRVRGALDGLVGFHCHAIDFFSRVGHLIGGYRLLTGRFGNVAE